MRCFSYLAVITLTFGMALITSCDDNDNKTEAFTVSFETGDGGSTVSPQKVKKGEKVIKPEKDPTRSGYAFVAWYKEAELTNEWKFDTDPVITDMTLYAKWKDDADYRWYGNGTASIFYIGTAKELEGFANLVNGTGGQTATNFSGKTIKLTADIDLAGVFDEELNENKGRIPIGINDNPFSGNFDGDGKIITGLYINNSMLNVVGLFGIVDGGGVVQNLGVVDVQIIGNNNVGGIAGEISGSGSRVTNCYSTGIISGNNDIGGVVGYVDYGSVTNCYSAATVSGNNTIGGVAGSVDQGNVINCYSIGAVSSYYVAGGIAASVIGGNLTNCAALNPNVNRLSGSNSDFGRVVGFNGSSTLSGNIAFNGLVVGGGVSSGGAYTHNGRGGESKSAAELHTASGFPADLTKSPWTYSAGKLPGLGAALEVPKHLLGPFSGKGTSDEPYMITTAEHLTLLADLVNADTYPNPVWANKYYQLSADIDLSDYGKGAEFNSGNGWIPIGGRLSNRFYGNFDGNGKNITGLYMSTNAIKNFFGLFGIVDGGIIQNLGVVDVNITGDFYYVGGVAGYVGGGGITNCYTTGVITGYSYVGGIAGHVNSNGSVTECYSKNIVNGNDQVGGIVGYVYFGNVTNCYSTGTISGNNCIGGVVGNVEFGSVAYCYSTGAISGNNGLVGGVAGVVSGIVINCAALNPSITSVSSWDLGFGRVAGSKPGGELMNNIAFEGMLSYGMLFSGTSANNDLGGESKTAGELQNGSGFPERLTKSPWIYEKGMLPGLGATVEMPKHLKL